MTPRFSAQRPPVFALLPAALVVGLVSVAEVARAQPDGTAAEPVIDPGYLHVRGLLSENRNERREAEAALIERDDPTLAFGVVDALFFIPRTLRGEAFDALEAIVDEKWIDEDTGESYWDWVEVMGRLGETIRPAPGYAQWKAVLLGQIDEGYREILYPGVESTLRLEEVVTGGVAIEGIPALDDPRQVPAAKARYLDDDEEVFGTVVDGVAMAYPLRILDWHEMSNDTIGDVPVTLSYCTLCGSAILYRTDREGAPPRRFGTSGLLYRSNKLMLDRESKSLWSNLTGEPVVGQLVGSGQQLEILPITRTTWEDWRRRHPETLVVDLDDELEDFGRKYGFDYRPGRADQARRGVEFPVWKKSDALEAKDEIFVLRLGDAVTAYPLETIFAEIVVHDAVGDVPVVLVADGESGAVRAYRRPADATFRLAEAGGLDVLVDAAGARWRIGEGALEAVAAEGTGAAILERLPGHYAFWFGWYAFYPRTEVYRGSAAE